jgi:hypothetical protein
VKGNETPTGGSVTQTVDRWFLKCAACKKPWAVELPRAKKVVGGIVKLLEKKRS